VNGVPVPCGRQETDGSVPWDDSFLRKARAWSWTSDAGHIGSRTTIEVRLRIQVHLTRATGQIPSLRRNAIEADSVVLGRCVAGLNRTFGAIPYVVHTSDEQPRHSGSRRDPSM
jgi:hypothetical protein